MADSNSTAPRCPCGFWGTPQTGGLCSKCYKDKEQKAGGVSGGPSLPITSLGKPMEQDLPPATPPVTTTVSASEENGASKSTDTSDKDAKTIDTTEVSSDSGTEGAAEGTSSENGAKKRDSSEVVDDAMDCDDLPVQKNKKRCFKCNTRLELAIREIGRCQCNYIFCQMHRLPEQHDCVYDHKEKGRKQAREKMVSPKKHAGTSIKRMDSHS